MELTVDQLRVYKKFCDFLIHYPLSTNTAGAAMEFRVTFIMSFAQHAAEAGYAGPLCEWHLNDEDWLDITVLQYFRNAIRYYPEIVEFVDTVL
jgi:hypothetical protein